MRNIVVLLVLFIFLSGCAFPVDWFNVSTRSGKSASIDIDSIKEYDNYYFYNVKVLNTAKNQEVVITIQTKKRGGLSSRINFYEPVEYENLNGDYSHITDKMTDKLELVEYGSIVSVCNRIVNQIITSKQIQVKF